MEIRYTVNAKADGMRLGDLETQDGTLESCIAYVKENDLSPEDVEICKWECGDDEICAEIITEW